MSSLCYEDEDFGAEYVASVGVCMSSLIPVFAILDKHQQLPPELLQAPVIFLFAFPLETIENIISL